ncbi:MAG: MotA/TolQ/ExbB proton channel family protein [Ignavibacteriales bacterium]|nr:MotA/TolQ/ExbB proton channel family protein [Ignavibacteriales bacterium]
MQKKFEIIPIIAWVVAVAGILLAYKYIGGGKILTLIGKPALEGMIIVFIGTLGATVVGQGWDHFTKVPSLMGLAFNPLQYNVKESIDQMVNFASVARKDGVLALEKELPNLKEPFFKKMLSLAIDGNDPDVIRSIAETEMTFVAERHSVNAKIFDKMGGYSPTLGIIGTVVGLIATFAAAAGGDPQDLIKHISTAFIATLWGIFLANLVFLPIGDKLKNVHLEEAEYMEVVMRGVISIQEGEAPSIVKAKLYSMLPASKQEKK